jgi:hypothetical protein
MKSDGFFKQVIGLFAIVLVVYIVTYSIIEHRRTRHGPWQIAFTNDLTGAPALLINQPKLAITNVLISFTEELWNGSSAALNFAFTQPRAVPFDLPYGRCIFIDTTSLPGTLAVEMFGHEIQLIPRVLTIDKKEQPWRSGSHFKLGTVGAKSD